MRGSQNSSSASSWSSNTSPIIVQPFSRPVGPAVALSACILELFKIFFTPELINLIVEQTNLYASQVMTDDQNAKWVDVNEEEIWAYMGFMILMGINHLPALSDYWKMDPTYRYKSSPVADRITRDRFFEITRYFHFVDNTTLLPRGDPGYDKLSKVRLVIDTVSKQFLQNYNPHREN